MILNINITKIVNIVSVFKIQFHNYYLAFCSLFPRKEKTWFHSTRLKVFCYSPKPYRNKFVNIVMQHIMKPNKPDANSTLDLKNRN